MSKQGDHNKTTLFLTKFLFGEDFNSLKRCGFINTYTDVIIEKVSLLSYLPKNKKYLFLMFNNKILKIEEVETIISLNPSVKIVGNKELINDNFIIYLEFPYEFSKDFEFFKNGEYSKLSERFKNKFPITKDAFNAQKVKIGREHTLYYHIFNKTEWLQEFWKKKLNLIELDEKLELWEKPNDNDLILNVNNYFK